MGKVHTNTRVDPDTKEQILEYADDLDVTESEAVRRLIRVGLAREGRPVTSADGGRMVELTRPTTMLISFSLVVSGLGLWIAGLFATGYAVPVYLTLGMFAQLLGVGLAVAAVLAQLVMAKPLRGLLGFRYEVVTDV